MQRTLVCCTIFDLDAYTVRSKKGVILLSAIGYIQVHAYTSAARLPLEDVAVTITAEDGTAIAMRVTDRNGQISPIEIPVPDRAESLSPGSAVKPFTNVNLFARLRGFEQIEDENVQIFADTVTNQNLEMIPLSELPSQWDKREVFFTPPQNL